MGLNDFLQQLDLDKLKKTLLIPEKLHSTDYDEYEAIEAVALQNLEQQKITIMNLAIENGEERKPAAGVKRSR